MARSGRSASGRACGAAFAALLLALLAQGCAQRRGAAYDLIVRKGLIHDGSGGAAFVGDVAVRSDRIAYVGPRAPGRAKAEIDATGLAVAPGFINMLSWSTETLLVDGRADSELRQGVTLQVMGEGFSMGPLNPRMKAELLAQQDPALRYSVGWTSLGAYLDELAARGVAPNVASFVGAGTVRDYVLGAGDVEPTPEQLTAMRGVVRQAMAEGALGVASALIYPPGAFADTHELIALAAEAADCGGVYATHIRSEGDRFLEAIDEAIAIGRAARSPTHLYHLKVGGSANWPKMEAAIVRIEAARAAGLRLSADIYPYTASSTGLGAAMPPWAGEGGAAAWLARLADPAVRARIIAEMRDPKSGWESVLRMAGADGAIVAGVRNPALRPLIGKSLAEIAARRGVDAEEAAVALVLENGGDIDMVYHTMSEANLRRLIRLPYVSIGSDAAAMAAEGPFLASRPHPRAYGTFARMLGRYARDERILSVEDAVRRMTGLAADQLGLRDRGLLRPGHYADIVIFDRAAIADRATYSEPHRYAAGVSHVFVNGVAALRNGVPTGASSGRVLRGPGWTGWGAQRRCQAAPAQGR